MCAYNMNEIWLVEKRETTKVMVLQPVKEIRRKQIGTCLPVEIPQPIPKPKPQPKPKRKPAELKVVLPDNTQVVIPKKFLEDHELSIQYG